MSGSAHWKAQNLSSITRWYWHLVYSGIFFNTRFQLQYLLIRYVAWYFGVSNYIRRFNSLASEICGSNFISALSNVLELISWACPGLSWVSVFWGHMELTHLVTLHGIIGQEIVRRPFTAKPLPEPMLAYFPCWRIVPKQNLVTFLFELNTFHWRKYIWKWRLVCGNILNIT